MSLLKVAVSIMTIVLLLTGSIDQAPAQAQLVLNAESKLNAVPPGGFQGLRLHLDSFSLPEFVLNQVDFRLSALDFQTGQLTGFQANAQALEYRELLLEQVILSSPSAKLDTFRLLNYQQLILEEPIDAQGQATLSDKGLSAFLNHPHIRNGVERALKKVLEPIGGGFLEPHLSEFEVRFLEKEDFELGFLINMNGFFQAPVYATGHLDAFEGKPRFKIHSVSSSGLTLPPELSPLLEEQLNHLLDPEDLLKKTQWSIRLDALSLKPGTASLRGTVHIPSVEVDLSH